MFGKKKGIKRQGSGDFEGTLIKYDKLKAYDMFMGFGFFILSISSFLNVDNIFRPGGTGNNNFFIALIYFIGALLSSYVCIRFWWKEKLGYVKLGRKTFWINYAFKEKAIDIKDIKMVFPVDDRGGKLTFYRIVTDKNKMYDIHLKYFKAEDVEQIKVYFKKNLKKNFRG